MTSSARPNPSENLCPGTTRLGRPRRPVPELDDDGIINFPSRSDPKKWEHRHFERNQPLAWDFAAARPALGRAMLDAVHAMSGPGNAIATGSTALAYQTQTKPFFLFLAATGPDARGRLPGRDDLVLDPQLLEDFRIAMDLRATNSEVTGTTAYAYKSSPLRILRHIYLGDPDIFGPGWRDEDFLPGDRIDDTRPNQPYSLAEAQRIITACAAVLHQFHDSADAARKIQVEIAAFVILGLKLGIEPECLPLLNLANLKTDGRRIRVRYLKRRGGGGNGMRKTRITEPSDATRLDQPTSADTEEEVVADGASFREAAGVLALLRDRARSRQAKSGSADDEAHLFTFYCAAATFRAFSAHLNESGLRGDDGGPLPIVRNRLRPTWRTQRTVRHGGRLSIDRSDNSTDVRAKHYLDNDRMKPFLDDAISDAQSQAWEHALSRRVVSLPQNASAANRELAAEAAGVSTAEISRALTGEQDLWLASCRDFNNSPFDKPGTPCSKSFFGCVLCPNALITRRSLPGILGFRAHMERRREEMAAIAWDELYGATWREISLSILPQFDERTVAEAEKIARGLDMHLPPELIQ